MDGRNGRNVATNWILKTDWTDQVVSIVYSLSHCTPTHIDNLLPCSPTTQRGWDSFFFKSRIINHEPTISMHVAERGRDFVSLFFILLSKKWIMKNKTTTKRLSGGLSICCSLFSSSCLLTALGASLSLSLSLSLSFSREDASWKTNRLELSRKRADVGKATRKDMGNKEMPRPCVTQTCGLFPFACFYLKFFFLSIARYFI